MTEEPLGYILQDLAKKYKLVYLRGINIDIEKYHYILVLIHDYEEKLTQKGLAEILRVDKSYVVGIVNYLTRTGYVLREKDEKDSRCQVIKLTGKAKLVVPQIKTSIAGNNEISLLNVAESEIKIFEKVLNQIQENLSKSIPHKLEKIKKHLI